MSKIFRVSWYPNQAYLDFSQLTPDEIGVLMQIVNLIYMKQGPIDYDAKWISRSFVDAGTAKINRIIKKLIEKDCIQEIVLDKKRSKITQKMSEIQLETVRNSRETHSKLGQKGGRAKAKNQQNQPHNSKNGLASTSVSISTSISNREGDTPPFELFWNLFPESGREKGNKKDAEKKFKIATMITEPETIINGVKKYAAYIESSGDFNQDASKWLYEEKWERAYKIPKATKPLNGGGRSTRIVDAAAKARADKTDDTSRHGEILEKLGVVPAGESEL